LGHRATRSRALSSRIFAFLSLAPVVWSCAIILERLSSSDGAVHFGRAVEEMAAAFIVPAAAHLSLAIATEGHPGAWRRRIIGIAYVLSVLFALPGILTETPIQLSQPNLSIGPVPGNVLGWAWVIYRLGTLSIGAVWLLQALRGTPRSDPRRRQLGATLATVIVATVGGSIRFLPVLGDTDPDRISLVALAMILAAAAVLPAGVFIAPELAGRAFWTSIGLGIGLFLIVTAVLALEAASRTVLGLDLPLLTTMVLVITIALYEPAATWLRVRLRDRSPSAIARQRLLRALGQSTLTTQAADAGVQPALMRLAHSLDIVERASSAAMGRSSHPSGTSVDLPTPPRPGGGGRPCRRAGSGRHGRDCRWRRGTWS
jgi:hypothetical protein